MYLYRNKRDIFRPFWNLHDLNKILSKYMFFDIIISYVLNLWQSYHRSAVNKRILKYIYYSWKIVLDKKIQNPRLLQDNKLINPLFRL